MTNLTFTQQSNGWYAAELTTDTAGTLIMNLMKPGNINIYAFAEDMDKVLVDSLVSDKEGNFICSLDLAGLTVRVETESQVKKAKFA